MSASKNSAYEEMGRFRAEERQKMLATMSELIDDAQKRAKSHNTLSRDRPKWANLAGKLIWYRDQILRSMNYEALHKEMEELRALFLARNRQEKSDEENRTSETNLGTVNSSDLHRPYRQTSEAFPRSNKARISACLLNSPQNRT